MTTQREAMRYVKNRLPSENAQVAKLFCLFVVVLDHYYNCVPWHVMWLAMFVFGYYSGFFTFEKYGLEFSIKRFWANKVSRLGAELLITQTFLFILFLAGGAPHLFSIHTLLSFVGLNGLLSLAYIPLVTPYGGELWFLTLLILFYILFPAISGLNRRRAVSLVFFLFSYTVAYFCCENIQYIFGFWVACCGFLIGVFFSRHRIVLPHLYWMGGLVGLLALRPLCAHLGMSPLRLLNFFLITCGGVLLIQSTAKIILPTFVYRVTRYMGGCFLPIYLVHRHMFWHPIGQLHIDFVTSLISVVLVALILRRLSMAAVQVWMVKRGNP
jgi:hypothetical protein